MHIAQRLLRASTCSTRSATGRRNSERLEMCAPVASWERRVVTGQRRAAQATARLGMVSDGQSVASSASRSNSVAAASQRNER